MRRYRQIPGRAVAPYIAGELIGSLLGVAAARLVWGPAVAGPAVDYSVVRPAPGWHWAPSAGSKPAPCSRW
ncbi:hypothetical protein [Streptomyces niphimycinicus]|uniref:hypothetical protein n=1 Tax=Streptomyces niphimycinicus TaxID=2842201 RepID=UPI00209B6150|nr:hypothetical protein [Streptomyces niphimycinicus]